MFFDGVCVCDGEGVCEAVEGGSFSDAEHEEEGFCFAVCGGEGFGGFFLFVEHVDSGSIVDGALGEGFAELPAEGFSGF